MVSNGKLLAFINALGGGGPSEVVILPETELVYTSDGYILPVPLENAPAGGGNYKIVWDGVEYISPALDVTETMGDGDLSLAFGDSTILMGEEGAAAVGNPLPGAPFFMMLFPNGTVLEEGEPTFYGMFRATAEPTNPVLSIVQVGAASGGDAGGGVVTATAVIGDGPSVTSIDKTYSELLSAVKAGKYVQMMAKIGTSITAMPFVFWMDEGDSGYMLFSVEAKTVAAAIQYNADGTAEWAQ